MTVKREIAKVVYLIAKAEIEKSPAQRLGRLLNTDERTCHRIESALTRIVDAWVYNKRVSETRREPRSWDFTTAATLADRRHFVRRMSEVGRRQTRRLLWLHDAREMETFTGVVNLPSPVRDLHWNDEGMSQMAAAINHDREVVVELQKRLKAALGGQAYIYRQEEVTFATSRFPVRASADGKGKLAVPYARCNFHVNFSISVPTSALPRDQDPDTWMSLLVFRLATEIVVAKRRYEGGATWIVNGDEQPLRPPNLDEADGPFRFRMIKASGADYEKSLAAWVDLYPRHQKKTGDDADGAEREISQSEAYVISAQRAAREVVGGTHKDAHAGRGKESKLLRLSPFGAAQRLITERRQFMRKALTRMFLMWVYVAHSGRTMESTRYSFPDEIDATPVPDLPEEEAAEKLRRLRKARITRTITNLNRGRCRAGAEVRSEVLQSGVALTFGGLRRCGASKDKIESLSQLEAAEAALGILEVFFDDAATQSYEELQKLNAAGFGWRGGAHGGMFVVGAEAKEAGVEPVTSVERLAELKQLVRKTRKEAREI